MSFKPYVVMRTDLLIIALLSLVIAGCPGFGDEVGAITEVPDKPTWDDHVAPLMDRYCNDCHSEPAREGAPGFFRLDICENTELLGAKSQAARNTLRTTTLQSMPPASYSPQPTQIEREILERWEATGAPCEGEGFDPEELNNDNNESNQNNDNNLNNLNNLNNDNNDNNLNNLNNQNNTAPATFDVVASILTANCGTAACHGASGGIGNFAISTDSSLEDVQAALQDVDAQNGQALIVPENAGNSRLYQRVSTIEVALQMPPAPRGPLPEPQIRALESWINAGASYE